MEDFKNSFFLSFEQSRGEGLANRGKWRENYFNNNQPIVLELGCGKGEYSVGLAKRYPEKNFIGIDIKGSRIHTGAKMAITEGMNNVAFLRTRIDYIEACFGPDEVDELWITFPDPQPQTRIRKRLTHPLFLNRYKKILKPNALIHLKTDNEPFYDYTLETSAVNGFTILKHTNNLYANKQNYAEELTNIQTHYEKIFSEKGFKICYLLMGNGC